MQVTAEIPGQDAQTVDRSAVMLGVDEFSVLSRIQAGEIKVTRARSGEFLIPMSELQRISPAVINERNIASETESPSLSDEHLGIEWSFGGLRQNGQHPVRFTVPGYDGRFAADQIESYRAAFGSIARGVAAASNIRRQLNSASDLFEFAEKEIHSPAIGRWEVRAKLLALEKSEILLCQQHSEGEFAAIERFQPQSLYAKANGPAEVLIQSDDPVQLNRDFTSNARHTLEFMASNLVAKAQKIAWEQFPNQRPERVVAAISERCRRAVAHEQTINQRHAQSMSRGVRI